MFFVLLEFPVIGVVNKALYNYVEKRADEEGCNHCSFNLSFVPEQEN